jgi:dolichol-phosphate mannosyltransferase
VVVATTSRTCVTTQLWWWLLLGGEAAALAVLLPRLWRAARGGRRLEVDAVARPLPQDLRISVIIPARNEAARLADCLTPLQHAPGVLEVVVVDDESTDDTALVAAQHGAQVVMGAPLPKGWVGKVWALQQGITAARGDMIVTLDADARPAVELAITAAQALADSGALLATVAPRFRTSSPASQWLHAAMLTSLVYRYGAGAGRATADAVANGQCMVFRRVDAVDGKWCEQVRGAIIEDVALVRWLVAQGGDVQMFDGTSLLTVQMFSGFVDTWRGWGRSLSLSGVDRLPRQMFHLLITALTLITPMWLLLAGVATPVTMLLLVVRLGTLVGVRRAYERPGIGYWLSPVADLLAWVVVARGIVSPSREWRGRQY